MENQVLLLQRKISALAESATQSKDVAGPFWMIKIKDEFLSSPELLHKMKDFSWLNFLTNKSMGTKGVVSFFVCGGEEGGSSTCSSSAAAAAGCFCVFKTPRKLHDVMEKVGDTCIAEKMQSGIKFSPSSTHPEYVRLASIGALVVEQEGVISAHLVPDATTCSTDTASSTVEEAASLLSSSVPAASGSSGTNNAISITSAKKYCRRNGQRSVGCQVHSFAKCFAPCH